jgi:hypothetical protein
VSPGRELDALVAEKVLGCKPFLGTDGVTKYCNCGRTSSFDDGAHEMRSGGLKPYSTSISAAWEVVEKLSQQSRILQLIQAEEGDYNRETGKPRGWFAHLPRKHWDLASAYGPYDWTEGDTAPHAIALAALKAVGAM